MPNSSLMRSPLRGLKLSLLVFLLGAGSEANASEATAVRLGAALDGGGLRLRLAKSKKKRRGAPAGDKSKGGSGSEPSSDEETADEAPERPAKAAPEHAKATDDDDARPARSASSDDAEGSERAAPKRKRARPAAEGDGPEASTEATADEAPSVPGTAPTALELGFGGMALFRQLAWTSDAAAQGYGPYSLSPGPEAGLWLEFYPAAFATSGFAGNIGIFARYSHGFGVTSYTPSDGEVGTSYQDFMGGLKVRIPLGTFTPYLTGAYGEQTFQLTGAGQKLIPAMDYTFVRIGGGTRVKITPVVSIDIGAAFLAVSGTGAEANQVASTDYFPRTKAVGIDAGASVAWRATGAIGLRAGVDLRQYGLAFNPTGTTKAVTGAVDRYVTTFLGLEVLLDGAGGDLPIAAKGSSAAPSERSDEAKDKAGEEGKSDDAKSPEGKSKKPASDDDEG